LSTLKRFVQDTAIYGLATVMPRVMSIVLVGLHTQMLPTAGYAVNTSFYVGAAFLNVLFTYGMETAFFRFFAKSERKTQVYSTVLIALTASTLIITGILAALKNPIAEGLELPLKYFWFLIAVTALDTLVVAPFAYLRARGKSMKFAGLKLVNLAIYVVLNFFFLWAIPRYGWRFDFYDPTDLLQYIFISNLAASVVTFLLLTPDFFKVKLVFDKSVFIALWKYGWPVMVAGLAFVVNENLDKLLLGNMLDKDIMGAYSGCYKLAVFMTIFIQAFRLGAEPFFFNHAKNKNAPLTYATIMKYFVVVGAGGLLTVMVFIDLLKELLIRNPEYWKALNIVPVVLLANLCLGIYHNLSVWYKLTDKTSYGMYFSIMGAILTIVLNVVFIPMIGFMASAYATLVAYGFMMVISFVYGKKYYEVPYNLKKIGFYLVLAVVLSAVSFHVFRGNYVVSAILLLSYLIVIFFAEREELKAILSRS